MTCICVKLNWTWNDLAFELWGGVPPFTREAMKWGLSDFLIRHKFVTKICQAFLPPEFGLAACHGSQRHSEQTDTRDFLKHVNFGDHPWVCKEVEELDRGLIRSSPRNVIGSIYNKNLECWSQVGHLLDTLRYWDTPIPKRFWLLITFSSIMMDYLMSLILLSTC